MNHLRIRPILKPTTFVAALLISQGVGTCLLGLTHSQQAAEAFPFGKKKNADADSADQDGKDKEAKGDGAKIKGEVSKDAEKGKGKDKDAKSKEEEPPKEKHLSKEEIKEEEELEAEYAEYQKQLNAALKAVKTPFGSNGGLSAKAEESELDPLTISGGGPAPTGHLSLGARLLQCKVYMPGHMVIGRPAEFTIKGRPGHLAALAMADRDTGAKPIYGQKIRLGPDRKVVALGKIPASGVLQLKIFAPVAGDLVGGKLFFEAAIWPDGHPEQLELAQPVSSETQLASSANSVGLTDQGERKHGIKFQPDYRSPYSRGLNGPGLGSGNQL